MSTDNSPVPTSDMVNMQILVRREHREWLRDKAHASRGELSMSEIVRQLLDYAMHDE